MSRTILIVAAAVVAGLGSVLVGNTALGIALVVLVPVILSVVLLRRDEGQPTRWIWVAAVSVILSLGLLIAGSAALNDGFN